MWLDAKTLRVGVLPGFESEIPVLYVRSIGEYPFLSSFELPVGPQLRAPWSFVQPKKHGMLNKSLG